MARWTGFIVGIFNILEVVFSGGMFFPAPEFSGCEKSRAPQPGPGKKKGTQPVTHGKLFSECRARENRIASIRVPAHRIGPSLRVGGAEPARGIHALRNPKVPDVRMCPQAAGCVPRRPVRGRPGPVPPRPVSPRAPPDIDFLF